MQFPGMLVLQAGGQHIRLRNQKIPHKEILTAMLGPESSPGNLVAVYRQRVLPLKTRTIHLLGRKSPARVSETLLGFEVQGFYKRIQCPDRVTARYLKLFMEIGCRSIRLPYDPTITAAILQDLESSLEKIRSAIRGMFPGAPRLQSYVIRKVYSHLRKQLKAG
jgi:hypothetical protein